MRFSTWLAGLGLCVCATALQAQDSFTGAGFFLKNVTPAGAPAYQSFVKTIQQTPNVTAVFIDYREPITSAGAYDHKWSNNANWSARNFAQLCRTLKRVDAAGRPNLIPIISVGLTDEPTAFRQRLPAGHPDRGRYHEAAAVAMMNDISKGKYNAVWTAILDAYRNNGFNKFYLRIGWEQNGNWYGWRVRNEATRAAYVAAWRRVADLAHTYAATHAMTIETVWSPAASYANYGMPETSSYPGDQYVDIIGPDAYSPIWNPTRASAGNGFFDWSSKRTVTLAEWFANRVNRRHIWDHPASDYYNPTRGWGLPAALDFAREHNKRFALSEVGTGNKGMTTAAGGPADEGDYPHYVAERLSAAVQRGLQLEFVDLWAEATGTDGLTFLSGARPKEAAGWKAFMNTMAGIHTKKNIALRKRVYASSSRDAGSAASKAVDGKPATSWTTNGKVSQWLQVDLGQRFTLSRVRLRWNAGFASSYQIQTSLDAKTWKNVLVTSTANGGVDDLVGLHASGRFLRIVMLRRPPQAKHYSLQEFEVYP
jgi:hypothetical protein